MSKGLFQSKSPQAISTWSLPHPWPPISDHFYLQSISNLPAPPGSIISVLTISHPECGASLLSNFSVPVPSSPASIPLSPNSKNSRDEQSRPSWGPGAPPGWRPPDSGCSARPQPLFHPAEDPPGTELGKPRPRRVGSRVWSSSLSAYPLTELYKIPQPLHTFLSWHVEFFLTKLIVTKDIITTNLWIPTFKIALTSLL